MLKLYSQNTLTNRVKQFKKANNKKVRAPKSVEPQLIQDKYPPLLTTLILHTWLRKVVRAPKSVVLQLIPDRQLQLSKHPKVINNIVKLRFGITYSKSTTHQQTVCKLSK